MRWWLSVFLALVTITTSVFAYRMEKPSAFSKWDCPSFSRLNHYLEELWNITNGRYAIDTIEADPNGARTGDRGEMVQANFSGGRYFCVNVSAVSPGSTWNCVAIGGGSTSAVVPFPTTGMFCPGALSTSMACEQFRGRIPQACTVSRIDATVTTAPTTSGIIVDVNECTTPTACTSLWNVTQGNRLTIAAGDSTASQTTFDDTAIANGNYIGFDVDQVGITTTGSNLTVTLVCQ